MIPEPSSPLWSAVKAMYDSWPPDNEDDAHQLGTVLRRLGDAAFQARSDLHDNAQAVHNAWYDEAGTVMVEKIIENAGDWASVNSYAQHLGRVAEKYANDLVAVKQAIVDTIAKNERQYVELRFRQPFLAIQFAAAIADHFRRMVGGAKPVSGDKPGLMDRIGNALGDAADTAWTLAFGEDTGGPCIGASGSAGVSGGFSACLVRDPEGNFAIVNSVTGGLAPTEVPGGVGGVGVVTSNAPTVDKLAGTAGHVGVSAADVAGGSVSYDRALDGSTYAVTGIAGVGAGGVGADAGWTQTKVMPVTPGNVIKEGLMIGSLTTGNPIPFIMNTLGWMK